MKKNASSTALSEQIQRTFENAGNDIEPISLNVNDVDSEIEKIEL